LILGPGSPGGAADGVEAREHARRSDANERRSARRKRTRTHFGSSSNEVALAEPGATYRTVARRLGVTREEICKYMVVLKRLPPEMIAAAFLTGNYVAFHRRIGR
jgi:hypothetical protein